MKRFVSFVYFFIAATLVTLRTAHAYIDPSSMTYLIQIIAGAAIAVGAGVGFYWKRIRRYFRNRKRAREEAKYAAEAAAEEAAEEAQKAAEAPVSAADSTDQK